MAICFLCLEKEILLLSHMINIGPNVIMATFLSWVKDALLFSNMPIGWASGI